MENKFIAFLAILIFFPAVFCANASVELVYPDNGSVLAINHLEFYFIYHKGDNGENVSECNLYIGKRTTNQGVSLPDGEQGVIQLANSIIPDGNYTWWIQCDDAPSEKRVITILQSVPGNPLENATPSAQPAQTQPSNNADKISVALAKQADSSFFSVVFLAIVLVALSIAVYFLLTMNPSKGPPPPTDEIALKEGESADSQIPQEKEKKEIHHAHHHAKK